SLGPRGFHILAQGFPQGFRGVFSGGFVFVLHSNHSCSPTTERSPGAGCAWMVARHAPLSFVFFGSRTACGMERARAGDKAGRAPVGSRWVIGTTKTASGQGFR